MDGYEGHRWDGDKDPLAEVWRGLAQARTDIDEGRSPTYRFFGIESATGTSKTYALARIVLWFLDCYPDSLIVTTAPKQDQLKLNLWSELSLLFPKFKGFRPDAQLYKLRLVAEEKGFDEKDPDAVFNSNSWHAIGYVSGVGKDEESAGKVRGFHRRDMLIVAEEATHMSHAVMTAFQNTCTGQHNLIVAVGNPTHEHDPLHRFCGQKNVKSVRISAYDYPNIVLQKELFHGAVTQTSIDARRETYGEGSELFNAMVRGISPKQSQDSLIKSEWLEQAYADEAPPLLYGVGALGVDVANSEGGDKAAVAYGKDNVLLYIKEFYCSNATHLAHNIIYPQSTLLEQGRSFYGIPTMKEYNVTANYIGVDAVGVGVATVNAFVDEGHDVQALQGGKWEEAIPTRDGKPLYTFESLRAQMYWELREDLRNGDVVLCLPVEQRAQLAKELMSPRLIANGKHIAVESKEAIKKRLGKSPNVADAVVYWNWARKGYRIKQDFELDIVSG